MGEPSKVFYFAPENSGVAWYRFYQPLEDLRERGLIELRSWGFDFTGKKYDYPSTQELKEIIGWGDTFIFGRCDMPEYFKMMQTVKEFSGKKILLDIDDNIFSISPYIPASQGYAVNGPTLKLHEEIARYVDGVIVSTPALAEIYNKFNKTFIVPNGAKYLYPKREHQDIRIGYFMTHSHLENAQIVESALIKLLMKYSNVILYYTRSFSGFMDRIPSQIEKQVNYLPFFPLKDYHKYINNLGIDIAVAPLMNNDFNRCKSNIRVLESWQNGCAVVASPLDEYAKTIEHGFNGYLSKDDEWFYWLEDLVTNPQRRDYLAANGTRTLANYDVSIGANKYYEVLREYTNG